MLVFVRWKINACYHVYVTKNAATTNVLERLREAIAARDMDTIELSRSMLEGGGFSVAEHRQAKAMLIRALREVQAELRAAGETPAKLYDWWSSNSGSQNAPARPFYVTQASLSAKAGVTVRESPEKGLSR